MSDVTPLADPVSAPAVPIPIPAPAQPSFDLPEVKWTWRRVFTYVLTLILCALVALVIWRMPSDAQSLRQVCFALLGMIVLQTLLYMVGPTVEHLKNLVSAVEFQRILGPFGGRT